MLKAFVNQLQPAALGSRQKRDARVGQRPGRASLDYITGYGKPCAPTARTNTVTIKATHHQMKNLQRPGCSSLA